MTSYLIPFLLSAGVCILLTPATRRLAFVVGAIDAPGGRRMHREPTSRLGGVAIVVAVFVALVVATALDQRATVALRSTSLWGAAAAVAAVAITGCLDDVFGLSAPIKLLVELLAALMAFANGYCIDRLFNLSLGYMSLPATLVWIVVVTNGFNLVDGMDGLAAGIGVIISATLFVFSLMLGSVQGALVLAALSGALLGFMPYNFPPARVFLGDGGSLSIGIILALISIQTSNKLAAGIAIIAPALAMGLPLAEITVTVMRRTLRRIHVVRRDGGKERYDFLFIGKTALLSADCDHIHHRLLSLGLSKAKAVLTYIWLFYSLAHGRICSGSIPRACLRHCCLLSVVLRWQRFEHLGYEELRPLRRGTLLPIFDIRRLNLKIVPTSCSTWLASIWGTWPRSQ